MVRSLGVLLLGLGLLAYRSMVYAYTSSIRQSMYVRRSPLKILTADDMMIDEDSSELIKTLQLQMNSEGVPAKEVRTLSSTYSLSLTHSLI